MWPVAATIMLRNHFVFILFQMVIGRLSKCTSAGTVLRALGTTVALGLQVTILVLKSALPNYYSLILSYLHLRYCPR